MGETRKPNREGESRKKQISGAHILISAYQITPKFSGSNDSEFY